jgi:hypothetical protein
LRQDLHGCGLETQENQDRGRTMKLADDFTNSDRFAASLELQKETRIF